MEAPNGDEGQFDVAIDSFPAGSLVDEPDSLALPRRAVVEGPGTFSIVLRFDRSVAVDAVDVVGVEFERDGTIYASEERFSFIVSEGPCSLTRIGPSGIVQLRAAARESALSVRTLALTC